MRRNDVIPPKDNEFDDFQDNLVAQVTANMLAWNISAAAIAVLTALQVVWVAAWAIAKNKKNRTSAQIEAKIVARDNYEPALRDFIQLNIRRNPAMTDADRESCGIKPIDHTRSHRRDPIAEQCFASVEPKGGAVYIFRFRTSHDASRASMAEGSDSVLLVFKIADTLADAPKSPEELTEQAVTTRATKTQALGTNNIGKYMFFYCRYAILAHGELSGPWSALYTILIA